MTYGIKELFYTLQGEGANMGRAAVFCRFAGCNLWSGREEDRVSAVCNFCDTDFIGTEGGKFKTPDDLANAAWALWPINHKKTGGKPLIVCTGGEPLLQLDVPLIVAFQKVGFEVAVESNGTLPAPTELDWVCISPKTLDQLVQTSGDELKLVYPQAGVQPEDVVDLDFRNFFLQPMDAVGKTEDNTQAVINYCRNNPKWRLSLQSHKILGIR